MVVVVLEVGQCLVDCLDGQFSLVEVVELSSGTAVGPAFAPPIVGGPRPAYGLHGQVGPTSIMAKPRIEIQFLQPLQGGGAGVVHHPPTVVEFEP